MNHYEANRILDRVREGQQFSQYVITRALELTGDYETNGKQGMDSPLPQESARGRTGGSLILVAADFGRHCQEAKPGSC